jgi:hypothetical protein
VCAWRISLAKIGSRVKADVDSSRSEQTASALTSFVAFLRLVDDINATLAAHELIVAMAATQRLQGITDFHRTDPRNKQPAITAGLKMNLDRMPYRRVRINPKTDAASPAWSVSNAHKARPGAQAHYVLTNPRIRSRGRILGGGRVSVAEKRLRSTKAEKRFND